MAEKTFFFETNGTGDGTGTGYTDDEMFEIFRSLLAKTANFGGVAPDYLNELEVTGTVSPVAVNTGGGIIYGSPYKNSASVNVVIPTPAVSTRIDRVVLRLDWTAQTGRITRIAGAEGGAAPALTQNAGTTWDVPLAQVSITTGGVITVTDEREWIGGVGDGTITSAKLADDAVIAGKIADDGVVAGNLADNAVVAGNVANDAIDPSTKLNGTNGVVANHADGDARGTDSVDLQTARTNANEVTAGDNSVIAGGHSNRHGLSSHYGVIGGGQTNYVQSGNTHSVIGGGQANTIVQGQHGVIGGGSSNDLGDGGNVADYSVIAGGQDNDTKANHAAIGGGRNNLASGLYASIPGGYRAVANKYGQLAHAAGFFAAVGDAQASRMVARIATTNATPAELFLDGVDDRMTIPTDTTWAFSILLVARRTDADGESAAYKFEGCIDNNAGTTALVGAVTKTVLAEDTAAWDADVTADNTNDALIITVTGEAAKTIRWVAKIELVEVTG